MRFDIHDFDEFDKENETVRFICPFCKEEINFAFVYFLIPTNDKEYEILEKRLGDRSNWIACEDCIAGYCDKPNYWFKNIFPKLPEISFKIKAHSIIKLEKKLFKKLFEKKD